jgi:zinc protease
MCHIKKILIFLCFIINISSVSAHVEQLKQYTLDNGLRVILKEDRYSPIVLLQLWYKVGSGYDTPSKTGSSYLLKQILSHSSNNPHNEFLKKFIFEKGGENKADLSLDYTVYSQIISSKELEFSLEAESSRMNYLMFNEDIFSREKQNIVTTRRLEEDVDKNAVARDRFYTMVYPNSGYNSPLKGWVNDLEELQIEDLYKWYKDWYTPNNVILTLAGNINLTKAYKLVQKYFGNIAVTNTNVNTNVKAPSSLLGYRRLEVNLPIKVPQLLMGYNVPSLNTAKYNWEPFAIEVLVAILHERNNCRFSKYLLEHDEPLAFAVDASYDPFHKHATAIVFSAIPDYKIYKSHTNHKESLARLEEAIIWQIDAVQSKLVSNLELAKIKNRMLTKNMYEKESLFKQMYTIGSLEVAGYNFGLIEQRLKEIEAITAKQIQVVAKKYLVKDGLTVAYLTPED